MNIFIIALSVFWLVGYGAIAIFLVIEVIAFIRECLKLIKEHNDDTY